MIVPNREQPPSAEKPTATSDNPRRIVIMAIAGFAVGAVVMSAALMMTRNAPGQGTSPEEHVAVTPPPEELAPQQPDAPPPEEDWRETMRKEYHRQLDGLTLVRPAQPTDIVEWKPATLAENLGALPNYVTEYVEDGSTSKKVATGGEAFAFRIGTFRSGPYAGSDLYLAEVPCEGPCSFMVRFALVGDQMVAFTRHSDQSAVGGELAEIVALGGKYRMVADDTTELPGLAFPEKVDVTAPKAALERATSGFRSFQGFLSPKDQVPLFTHSTLGPAFARRAENGTTGDSAILFQAADGTAQVYRYVPPFVSASPVPPVVWKDGTQNKASYYYQTLGGCGFVDYGFLVQLPDNAIEPIGTLNGQPVYGPVGDGAYHDMYNGNYYSPDGKKPFTEFAASHPLFYWRDPFGRLMQFTNTSYVPQAECGKPVIYLYPTETTDVSVQVRPTGGMTKSDPAYGDGWHVTAKPDGQLTQKGTGLLYPYLFWEGRSDELWEMPDQGFVVAQADVSGFLDAKLAAQGLNAQETADFKEFWLPRFTGHPYYYVTFMGNALMDRIAPLTVEPRPDTVLRLLMDFRGLDAPIAVREPVLRAPEREGFTLVEWGGVIR